jgi:hypothetical protein
MPRYFFNAYYDTAHIDRDGQILADDNAAWREGTKVAIWTAGLSPANTGGLK